MPQMSVTQGLAELKLLDKRINKELGWIQWVGVSTKGKKVDEVSLKKTATSEYQSYMDLVKRRDTIKRAIVLSNANTQVSIGSKHPWTGTVAEAIEHKSSVKYQKNLLEKMAQNVVTAKEDYERALEESNTRLDRLLTSELGKDIKTNPETIAALTASFQETNKVTLVDPFDVEAKAKALEENIDAFETNVDWVISESNGKTMITV